MAKEIVVIKSTASWTNIEENAQAAIVQVFGHVTPFDWIEPYKVAEQEENRGSGFIINEDGYIITNSHVVHEAKRIWVTIPVLGRRIVHVNIVGFCPDRDLALLRIAPDHLEEIRQIVGTIPSLPLGDSDTVKRTDNIMVMGYPLGQYRIKSSIGVVSGREASSGQALIQMTAPINPGSSGGPLLNEYGQVVGITLAMIVDMQNVGYAIGVNELKQLLDRLYTEKLVRMPILGAQFLYANDHKARYLKNPLPAGLYISKVLKGSLFERAGIQAGDMLYEFNGFVLDVYGDTPAPWGVDRASLTDLIARVKLGATITMVIYRNGERKDINFILDLMPEYPIRTMYPDYEMVEYEVIGGMVIMQLVNNHFVHLLPAASDLVYYAAMENKINPVLVITSVFTGSLSNQIQSILPGDIICQVNGIMVDTLQSLRNALEKSLITGFVTIKTKRDVFAVFDIDHLLRDEIQMSKDFVYPLSKTIRHLIEERHIDLV